MTKFTKTTKATTVAQPTRVAQGINPGKAEPAVASRRAARKLDTLIAALHQPQGADMASMIAATGWQAHSIRGAMAGALKKRGHAITRENVDGVRVWRISAPAEAAVEASVEVLAHATAEAAG